MRRYRRFFDGGPFGAEGDEFGLGDVAAEGGHEVVEDVASTLNAAYFDVAWPDAVGAELLGEPEVRDATACFDAPLVGESG